MVKAHIVVLEGDGIGPEVTREAVSVLRTIAELAGHEFTFTNLLIGGASIDATGIPLTGEAVRLCKAADAVLLGAVGGPKWNASPVRPEEGLLLLRKELGLFCNVRPVYLLSEEIAAQSSPIKADRLKGVDLVFVRELTGGLYFGDRKEATDASPSASDTCIYSKEEVERVVRFAAHLAKQRRGKLTQVDKANVLATSRLWRKVTQQIIDAEYPGVALDHALVDSMAMHLIQKPAEFDVIVTENMFGDILTDEASVLTGSLGLLPSASLGASGPGVYEPIHGSAPDIAGRFIANPCGAILSAAMLLRHSLKLESEAALIESAVRRALADGFRTRDVGGTKSTVEVGVAIVERVRALYGASLVKQPTQARRRPMNLSEKILCHNAIGLEKPEVRPGEMICVKVARTLASELTWKGMEKTYDEMGRPSINNNDRFWLAIDHTVDPSINDQAKPKELIAASERFAKEAGITDFYGPNQTILHTEFYRERAEPGTVVVGADSHSCSAGGLGCWAVGLGAADVVMPLVTGDTWLQVPETTRIIYTGKLPFGIGGKDVILHTMGRLKRNTVAFERAVEYCGNIESLSCDARFAISNMTTEFGGIVGVFPADEITAAYIARRPSKYRSEALYFRADPDAEYAETHEIKLEEVDSLVALFPSPDNVVTVDSVAGKELDGCFIGACTTGEEDLILGALVLEVALAEGFKPVSRGKRKVTPGSVPIVAKLRKLGLIDVYQRAGFEIGAPGCSYCLGIAADRAGEGEVWLSSQNRNFRNRMGKGSIANLASAATVAASSLGMTIANPRRFLDKIDRARYEDMLAEWKTSPHAPIQIIEPQPQLFNPQTDKILGAAVEKGAAGCGDACTCEAESCAKGASNACEKGACATCKKGSESKLPPIISGKAQVFEDNIDTDAIIPAEFMPGTDDEDLGGHAFQYVRPEFVPRVKEGFNIIVAGAGFGSGSSREEAVRALNGCGIKAVIARSFAFIYARNQPNMGLLGIVMRHDRFYELAVDGAEITIDVRKHTVSVAGESFPFDLSRVEERLLAGGGVIELYRRHKNDVFRRVTIPDVESRESETGASGAVGGCGSSSVPGAAKKGCGDSSGVLSW